MNAAQPIAEAPAADLDRLAHRVRWGAGSKLAAELTGRALQFLLAYLGQRTLGPEVYGQFTYALAVGFVLAPLTDLGLQLMVTREVARDAARAAEIMRAGLALKSILTLAISAPLIAVSLTRPPELQAATLALSLAMIFNAFVEFLGYAFRGRQQVERDAALTLLMRLATFGLGAWSLASGQGLMGLAGAYVIGGGVTAILGYVWLRKETTASRTSLDLTHAWALLRQALPLGGAILFSIAYTRTAVFVLDARSGAEAVGLFGVAQKLIEPLAIIPAALMAAVFPAFTHRLAMADDRADGLRARSIRWLAGTGAAIACAALAGGPWLIETLYGGQYAGSEAAVQILGLAALPTFVNYALTHFLIALNRQRLNLIFNVIVFGLNLALCLILIPRFGPTGAAAAVLISECVLFVLCRRALPSQSRQPEPRSGEREASWS